jgi:hypothetical protein
MRVEWAVICRSLSVGNDSLLSMEGAGIDTFWITELPEELIFPIGVRIAGTEDELAPGVDHRLEGHLIGPNMTPLGTLDMVFQGNEPSPDHLPGWELNAPIGVAVRFDAAEEGPHSLDFYLDTKFAKSVPFAVRVGTPSA